MNKKPTIFLCQLVICIIWKTKPSIYVNLSTQTFYRIKNVKLITFKSFILGIIINQFSKLIV